MKQEVYYTVGAIISGQRSCATVIISVLFYIFVSLSCEQSDFFLIYVERRFTIRSTDMTLENFSFHVNTGIHTECAFLCFWARH